MRTMRFLLPCITLLCAAPTFAAEPVTPPVVAPAPVVTPPAVPTPTLPTLPPSVGITVLAPDGGIASLPPGPTPEGNEVGFIKLIIDAAKAGNWKLAVVLSLVLLVWLTRKFGTMIPGPVGKAIGSDAGGVITTFFWALLGVFSAALTAGVKIDLHLAVEALLLAFTAMGGWVAIKKVLPESWKAKMPWLFGSPADPAKP